MNLFFWRKKETAAPLRAGTMVLTQPAPARFVLTVSGVITPQKVAEAQQKILAAGRPGAKFRGLILAEAFQGWAPGFDGGLGEVERMVAVDEVVERMAVVAFDKWHENLRLFMGGWMRKAELKFFAMQDVEKARAWLES